MSDIYDVMYGNGIVLRDNASRLQDKQSFWNGMSEDKMWENKKQRKLESHIEYNIRPHQSGSKSGNKWKRCGYVGKSRY